MQQAALQACQEELRPQPCCPARPETTWLTSPSQAKLPYRAASTILKAAQLATFAIRAKAVPNRAACISLKWCDQIAKSTTLSFKDVSEICT